MPSETAVLCLRTIGAEGEVAGRATLGDGREPMLRADRCQELSVALAYASGARRNLRPVVEEIAYTPRFWIEDAPRETETPGSPFFDTQAAIIFLKNPLDPGTDSGV